MHSGSGLGNMLARYTAMRVLALDNGYDFSVIAPENFKGSSFMNLDMGLNLYIPYHLEMPAGKIVPIVNVGILWEEKTNYYNPEFNFIEDHTIIDGEFQDERYIEHRLPEIREWLKVEPLEMPDDLCIINFRGGEFQYFPELYLTLEYWHEAIGRMRAINPSMRFQVHTDDYIAAKKMFGDQFDIIADIGINWRNIRYAKYLILSNSSFAIIPTLLNEDVKLTIGPRYWGRRNTKVWQMPQNYYKKIKYI